MRYTVIYNYFNSKGDQHQKEITRASIPALIKAMKKHLENNEMYYIARVSQNLFDFDFEAEGIKEWKR